MVPTTPGTAVRYGFVCDPDGNRIKLSQWATVTGSLEPNSAGGLGWVPLVLPSLLMRVPGTRLIANV
jgi:hypothetical protein